MVTLFYTEKVTVEAGNYLIAYADVVVFFVWFAMTSSVHHALQKSHLDPFLSVFTIAACRKNFYLFCGLTLKATTRFGEI